MRSLPALALPFATAATPLHRRPKQAALLLLAVLLLHGLVFLAVAPGSGRAPGLAAPPRPAAIHVLAPAAPAARAAPPEKAGVPVSPLAAQSIDKATEKPGKKAADKPADNPREKRRVAAVGPVVQGDRASMPALPASGSAGESAALPIVAVVVPDLSQPPPSSEVSAVPVYVTKLPASAHLHYQLQRGAVVGSGQLVWQRQGSAYEISLDGELQGMPVLGSLSRGVIDIDGVAPLRLVDRRRSRELRAVNFQRDAQRITFSGPQLEYPLLAGAQDRLSWMIQLPGIVEADPALTLTGARITLFVVGTRGDAEAWHFEVQGQEPLELPAGAVANAIHLLREPRRPYDTRVEVWLDPARQHLPVRAVVTTVPGGQPLEFKLSRGVQAAL